MLKILSQVLLLVSLSFPLYGDELSLVGFKTNLGLSTQPNYSLSGESYRLDSTLSTTSHALTPIGLKLKTIKKDEVDCASNQTIDQFGPRMNNFVASLDNISSASSCLDIKNSSSEKFTANNCNMLIECSRMKTRNEYSASISAIIQIPKMIAEDYVGMHLKADINEMEAIDQLREFAEKKYGKDFVKSCTSPFNYNSKSDYAKDNCNAKLMDSGFLRIQKNCQSPQKNCYSLGLDPAKDYNTFENKFRSDDDHESVLQSYFKNRNENMVTDSLTNDRDLLESITTIMSSSSKSDEKIKRIISKMSDLKKAGKLDAAFGHDSDFIFGSLEASKKSNHYKFFAKLLASPINAVAARAEIEAYRKNYTGQLLTKSCSSVPSFNQICQSATALYKSKTLKQSDRVKTAQSLPEDKDEVRYELMKSFYPHGVKTKEDYNIVLDAQRCKAFGFVSSESNDYSGAYDLSGGSRYPDTGLSSSYDLGGSIYTSPNASFVQDYKAPLFQFEAPRDSDDIKKNIINALPGAASNSDTISSIQAKKMDEGSTLSSAFGEGLKASALATSNSSDFQSPSTNSGLNFNNFSDNKTSRGTSDAINAKPDDGVSAPVNTGTKALNDKIFDLNKKLSLAEENLERNKTEKEEAENVAARQKKSEEEIRSIADLKSQIADLKTQKLNTTPAETTSSNLAIANASYASVKASSSDEESVSESSNDKRGFSESDTQGASRSNFSGASDAQNSNTGNLARSGAQFSGSAAGSSTKTSLVLTKIDGLSEEKVAEAISDKILETGGQPFEIEEGGMVKQIVPIVKDGKVILDDKGHPRYEKVIRRKIAKNEADRSRAPTSIVNTADLKRDEEEKIKYERAKYLRLKKLTQDALDKK